MKADIFTLIKKAAAIGLMFITSTFWSYGEVLVENARLATQTQVDAFSNVSEVTGTLTISTDPTKGDPIVNLDGLKNLSSVGGDLFINDNNGLVDTLGLLSLTDLGGLFIFNNNSLSNLDGISNLGVCHKLEVHSNSDLSQFCGLYLLFESQGINWNYLVIDQDFQIFFEGFGDILALIGEPCDLPAQTIDPQAYILSLREDGVLNKGQANSLSKKLEKNSLRPLANQLLRLLEEESLAKSKHCHCLTI